MRSVLILFFSVFPSAILAQADSAQTPRDTAPVRASRVFAVPIGIAVSPKPDTTTQSRKEYHGLGWTLIGAGVGGLLGGGATAYLASFCEIDGDCRGAWRWIVVGAGVGAMVVGFFTGLVYGLFNG